MGELDNSEKQQSLKIEQLLSDLKSGVDTKILSALKSLQVNGNINLIRPIVELLMTDISHQIKTEVLNFLGDLKVTQASEEIIAIL